jgi:hypothetical protein
MTPPSDVTSSTLPSVMVANVGCPRRIKKCCLATVAGLRVSCSHRWYDTDPSVAVTIPPLVMGTCVAHYQCIPLHHCMLCGCRSPWAPSCAAGAVDVVSGFPSLITARDAACWCTCALLCRRRLRLRGHSFDHSWYGGYSTVSVCAVLSVVLPVHPLSLSPHYAL